MKFSVCKIPAVAVAVLGFLAQATAQNAELPKLSLHLKARYDVAGNTMFLRWAPMDYFTWMGCNANDGYRLVRFTTAIQGEPLDSQSIANSQVILAENILPEPEATWEAYAETDDLAGVVAGSLYGDSLEVYDPANTDISTVFNIAQERENRFSFSMFACDQNFEIALMAGLAFKDETVTFRNEYMYVVSPVYQTPEVKIRKGYAFILADEIPEPPAPANIRAIPGDLVVTIAWDRQDETSGETDYTSYQIERSPDGENDWETRNLRPFISLTQEGFERAPVAFYDSLPDNDHFFYYRVKGKTPFGEYGPNSEIVETKGVPALLVHAPHIYEIEEINPGTLAVKWEMQPGEFANVLNYEVFRSENIDGPYDSLGTTSMNLQEFNDNTAPGSAYYVVKAKDLNGKRAVSFPRLGQVNDVTAPATPTGLQGGCDLRGKVKLHWNPNTEPDLWGYRVFTSNEGIADTDFIQITPAVLPDTIFYYEINLNTLTEDILFRIKAVDKRENESDMTASCVVKRPDIVPPSAPVFSAVRQRPAAVEFDWMRSSSADVTRYVFQKRKEGGAAWTTLADFAPADSQFPIVDSLSYLMPASRRIWYQYRMLARDEAGNLSSSPLVRAKPFDDGLRAPIQNLAAVWLPVSGGNSKGQVLLTWDYPDDVDLLGFQIYRAIDNSLPRPYEFVEKSAAAAPGNPLACTFRDFDLDFKSLPARAAFLQPPSFLGPNTVTVNPGAVNQPAQQNPNAPPQPVTLHYRVVALFADGAESPLSPDVSVQIQ